MKWLLILLLLVSGCAIKEDEVIEEETPDDNEQEVVRGTHDDFVILKEGIVFPEHDEIVQDYYSNSLAFYKDDALVAFYSPQAENLIEGKNICSVNLRDFFETFNNPADPGNLSITCDGERELYAYGKDQKVLYSVGKVEPDYLSGRRSTIKMLYINKNSPIIKEIDVNSYLHRSSNDPLIIKEYGQYSSEGIYPVYELNEEPKLEDNVLTFDLTGKVGIVTGDSSRADILETIKFDGVGADTSTQDGLVTVYKDGKIGLADKKGQMVIEPQYDPIKPITHQIYSENFPIKQTGPTVVAFDINNFINDYWSNTHFISTSSHASGYRPVMKNGKVGFLDESGKELDTFYFEDALVAKTNRIWVKTNDSWSIIEVGKDIGYQQQTLIDEFNQEPELMKSLTEKYLSGALCEPDYKLYEVNSTTGLYIRDDASLESGYLGLFNYQQKVCGKIQGEWVQFDYNGFDGYLYAQYMDEVER